jgi:hypothetical protein
MEVLGNIAGSIKQLCYFQIILIYYITLNYVICLRYTSDLDDK